MATTNKYNVEFDDSLLDYDGWKKPRYEGSKLTGAQTNQFTEGDITYGKNAVVSNKQACLFIGNTLIGQGEQDDVVELEYHSYAQINRLLLIDTETDDVTIVERSAENKEAFNRFITSNLPEGGSCNFKLLDFSIQTNLKQDYNIKYNRGLFMRIYTYTPNTDGHEDFVFGGTNVSKKSPSAGSQNLTGSEFKGENGMFGVGLIFQVTSGGSTIFQSGSLYQSASKGEPGIHTQTPFPSELSEYTDAQVIDGIDNFVPTGTTSPRNAFATPSSVTLQQFYNEWVFHDILEGNNNYFVTFEKGGKSPQNNKLESIGTNEITHPQVNSSYNPALNTAFTNFLEPIEKTSMNSNDIINRNHGRLATTSLRGNRFFQARFQTGNSSAGVSIAQTKTLTISASKSYNAVSLQPISAKYEAAFYYPFTHYQLSVLRESPTVILDIDKETEVFIGIGEKGFVIVSNLLQQSVRDNIDFYLEKAGLIEKTTLRKTPKRGL